MATFPGSGQASTADFISTFGAPTAGNTSQMYRGGSYVPDISANNAIPTSGAADSADFYGSTDYTPMGTPALSTYSTSDENVALAASTTCSVSVSCSIPSGGNASKTYTWERVSGTTLTVSQGNTGTFSRSANGVRTTSVYRCKVTDGTGTTYSPNVTITFTHWSFNEGAITNESDFDQSPGSASATVAVYRNGSGTGVGNWVEPAITNVGDLFDVYFNFTAGSASSGSATLTALTINTARSQTVSASTSTFNANDIKSSTCRVRIRRKTVGGYLFDKSVTLTASVESLD